LLALGTFPVFLNLKAQVRNHVSLTAFTFFALPLVIMGCVAFSLEDEAWTGLLFCVPYLTILSIFFVRFRNQKDV